MSKEQRYSDFEETRLVFDRGSLLIDSSQWSETLSSLVGDFFQFDSRTRQYRALGMHYGTIVTTLHQNGIPYRDDALAFERLEVGLSREREPRDYQLEAIQAWENAGRRGVVVLPTGAGKSFVALMAICSAARSAMVIVPTIDLMIQWAGDMEKSFGRPVGMLGGGSRDLRDITVSTYDSALLQCEYIGNRFGMLIFDECHHLPGESYQFIARAMTAPFRLGLTATPEREDGGEDILYSLLGRCVFKRGISDFRGEWLSSYETIQIDAKLTDEEREEYLAARKQYTSFAASKKINMKSLQGWKSFLTQCFRSREGREAYRAYRRQREISRSCRDKMLWLWKLLRKHAGERALVFTDDNATAYLIGERLCLPVITHQTKAKERKAFLDGFRGGSLPCLVTSRVLNEGVDVPAASVGIVVSGTGSVREHVQRLGRILRKAKGKSAVLYEIVTQGTTEVHQSQRRRDHHAYKDPASL